MGDDHHEKTLGRICGSCPIHCDQPTVATVKSTSSSGPGFFTTPSAKARGFWPMLWLFFEEFDPFRQFSLLAEGGGGVRICLTSALFWPSANSLPWRRGGQGGGGVVLCHILILGVDGFQFAWQASMCHPVAEISGKQPAPILKGDKALPRGRPLSIVAGRGAFVAQPL